MHSAWATIVILLFSCVLCDAAWPTDNMRRMAWDGHGDCPFDDPLGADLDRLQASFTCAWWYSDYIALARLYRFASERMGRDYTVEAGSLHLFVGHHGETHYLDNSHGLMAERWGQVIDALETQNPYKIVVNIRPIERDHRPTLLAVEFATGGRRYGSTTEWHFVLAPRPITDVNNASKQTIF